ncbi:MAG: fatty acid desaturase, family 1 [Gammaproteobacteria bacterium]|jgi:stearoyl-CoA desaturase (delta-9 desaturase)|nr:fatty acid desaturase, family 1 [Gammaproteobacteria bacterium]
MTTSTYRNWQNILFFITVPLLAIAGTIWLCLFSSISWQTWTLAGVLLVCGGLSITAGYHRLFAHRTYQAAWPVQLFFALFGASAFEGSVLEWSTDHRNHHRYTDTPRDPYNINQGFWYAHIGWIFTLDESKRDFTNVADLQANPLLRMQHRYYTGFAFTMGLILPTVIAACWGEALAGFIVAGLLRLTILHHGTFCINSLCHTMGSRRYSKTSSARDNWLSAFVTFGEGYHNYHHQFPRDYRNGVRFYHFDPSKWTIYLLARLKLASHLYRTPDYHLIQARFESGAHQLSAAGINSPIIVQLQEAIQECIAKIKHLEAAYAEATLKELKEYQVKIKLATLELLHLFRQWKKQLARVPALS